MTVLVRLSMLSVQGLSVACDGMLSVEMYRW